MPKTVLIFGASSGIGAALFQLYNKENVYGFARGFENDQTANTHYLDLSKENVRSETERLLSTIESIDYVIYNAGTLINKPFLELTRADISMSYDVNVVAAMEVLQVCIPKMNKGGHIVTISSMGGFQGSLKFAGLAAYSPSKAALSSLTELLAEEFKDKGFSINCLCLGAVQTEMLATAFPGYEAPHSAEEMAEFIYHFTEKNGKFMTGKIIPVSISNP